MTILPRVVPHLLLAAFVVCGDARTVDAQNALPSAAPPQPAFRFPDEIAPAAPLARPPRAISRPNEGAADAPPSPGSRPVAPSLWGTLGPLALIIVLILAAARVWRKHGPLVAQALPSEVLEVLGRRPLDARQSIQLVRLGSRILVLGSSTAGLQTLAEITDPVEVDLLSGLCRRKPADANFTETFRGLFGRSQPASAGRTRTAGEQRFAERLKQLAEQDRNSSKEAADAA